MDAHADVITGEDVPLGMRAPNSDATNHAVGTGLQVKHTHFNVDPKTMQKLARVHVLTFDFFPSARIY